MNRAALVILLSTIAAGSAIAQTNSSDAMQACSVKAITKEGKPLVGAAKTSSIRKCCEGAAVSKEGKPLAGAARASFLKKCEGDT